MLSNKVSRRDVIKTIAAGAALSKAVELRATSPSPLKRVGSTAQRLKEKPYEKRVCRVECYPSCLNPEESYVGLSVEEYAELIHQAGLEVQIVAGDWDYGTPRFPSKRLPPHPIVGKDRLPRFLEVAHEKGILVLTYYPIIYNKLLKKIHPEWLMRFLDDGRPEPENLGWFCLNSPFRDWLPQHLIDFLDNLDLDGLYFDDTNWGSHDERPWFPGCCCAHCEKLFNEETGLKIPTRVDFSSPDFRKFVNWRSEKLRDFFLYLTRRVKEKHPDAILDFNHYGRPSTDWSDGHPLNPLHLQQVGAHFFIETFGSICQTGFVSKVARAYGSPFAMWRNTVQTLAECVGSSAPYAEPWSQTLHGLTAMANGGRPQYGGFDGPMPLHRELMRSVFAEIKKRVDYIDGETVKYVALHCSQQSRNFYRPAKGYTESKDFREIRLKGTMGAYEMLNQSHLLVDMLLDEQLDQQRLSAYKVVFLSNSACLSEAQCDQIRRFVGEGGTVIATHETSLFDEWGQKRENFSLANIFGVNYRGLPGKGSIRGIVYVPQDPLLSREFGPVISFAGEESEVSLRPDAQVEQLYTRSNLKGERPLDNFDPKVNYDSAEPAITLCRFGKGEAIYISGDVGEGYHHNPYPVLKRFVAHLVRRTQPPVEVEAPRVIEVTAALRSPKELMIHLLNNPTPVIPASTPRDDITDYFYLEEVNPIRNVRIKVNDFKVKRGLLPLQGLSLEVIGDPPQLVVPEVKLHEVVILELEG
jgi:hypothetical protein